MELLIRIKAILLTPHTEWPVIAQEKGEASALFIRYVAILALIPALARFIGTALVGWYAPVLASFAGALLTYVSGFAIVYGVALIIEGLAPMFGAQKDFACALKLAVYSFTPVWLAGIFLALPGLRFLTLTGFYGAYLLWLGIPVLTKTPQTRSTYFTVIIVVCAFALTYIAAIGQHSIFGTPGL